MCGCVCGGRVGVGDIGGVLVAAGAVVVCVPTCVGPWSTPPRCNPHLDKTTMIAHEAQPRVDVGLYVGVDVWAARNVGWAAIDGEAWAWSRT